jgi:uncharacterized protein YbjT (DUF2867 family)
VHRVAEFELQFIKSKAPKTTLSSHTMSEKLGKSALIIGATGLVGKALLHQLLDDAEYASVTIFVRRAIATEHPKLKVHTIDFSKPQTWSDWVQGDVLFSSLGTTRSQAGGVAAQRVVDYDYQYKFAQLAAANGVKSYVLISSIGANANASNAYLKMKGELDRDVKRLGFPQTYILRPGPLSGPRENHRAMEGISIGLLGFFNGLGLLKKYRPISDQQVALAMRKVLGRSGKPALVLESEALFEF